MLFYSLTIILSMFLIGTFDYYFAVKTFNHDLSFIVFGVLISTIAVIVIDLIFAFIVRRILPEKWFGVEKEWFLAKSKERRFYEKIGIKKWKEKVLELGALTGLRKNKIEEPNNNEYIKRYVIEANYGVVVHIVDIFVGFLVVFVYPLKYWLNFGVPVAIVNAVLNLLPLMILRYNLPKLKALYKFNKKRTTNKQ